MGANGRPYPSEAAARIFGSTVVSGPGMFPTQTRQQGTTTPSFPAIFPPPPTSTDTSGLPAAVRRPTTTETTTSTSATTDPTQPESQTGLEETSTTSAGGSVSQPVGDNDGTAVNDHDSTRPAHGSSGPQSETLSSALLAALPPSVLQVLPPSLPEENHEDTLRPSRDPKTHEIFFINQRLQHFEDPPVNARLRFGLFHRANPTDHQIPAHGSLLMFTTTDPEEARRRTYYIDEDGQTYAQLPVRTDKILKGTLPREVRIFRSPSSLEDPTWYVDIDGRIYDWRPSSTWATASGSRVESEPAGSPRPSDGRPRNDDDDIIRGRPNVPGNVLQEQGDPFLGGEGYPTQGRTNTPARPPLQPKDRSRPASNTRNHHAAADDETLPNPAWPIEEDTRFLPPSSDLGATTLRNIIRSSGDRRAARDRQVAATRPLGFARIARNSRTAFRGSRPSPTGLASQANPAARRVLDNDGTKIPSQAPNPFRPTLTRNDSPQVTGSQTDTSSSRPAQGSSGSGSTSADPDPTKIQQTLTPVSLQPVRFAGGAGSSQPATRPRPASETPRRFGSGNPWFRHVWSVHRGERKRSSPARDGVVRTETQTRTPPTWSEATGREGKGRVRITENTTKAEMARLLQEAKYRRRVKKNAG